MNLLILLFLGISGCSGNFNLKEVSINKIINGPPEIVYLQVVTDDGYDGGMDRIIQNTKKVEHVKDVQYIRSHDSDYMSFWVPVTIGGNGRVPKTISVSYDNSLSRPEIGLTINGEWADQFPGDLQSGGILLNLCNDSSKIFVSTSSFNAAFNGWPSTYKRAHFPQGKCMETALWVTFNAPFIERDINGTRLLGFRGFLLEQ